jgi:hypothetical protein
MLLSAAVQNIGSSVPGFQKETPNMRSLMPIRAEIFPFIPKLARRFSILSFGRHAHQVSVWNYFRDLPMSAYAIRQATT